ncbi:ABC transporter substrate-binding protein [Limoniibacter endophyticus]|uniref:Peptide ABC transporter substrate-binding protein n=1 Tax=Limoniibacter endophyticus TaxID=1565040 RepID=A0A8J3GIG1_9HYPH|nr:ABC transporter substrate-binding protein [Limoniibacter endophyticus]GHC72062.1 peptide ABC transporter substrate-binding protein [Limoniibacter endophyticus]
MNKFLSTVAALALGVSILGTHSLPAQAETPPNQLVVAISMQNILTLDPAGITGRDAVLVLSSVYDSLLVADPADRTKFIPRLAESWEVAPDGNSITFKLREGVNFASGNPFTAEDVAYSFKRLMTLNLAQASFLKTRGFNADNADASFQVIDDYTFKLNLPQPDDPNFVLMTISQAGPGSIIDSAQVKENEQNGDWGAAWLKTNSAGSGAYKLNQWRSNENVLLDRNGEYWGEEPAMRRILIRHLPESQSQRLQLERGDIDVAYALLAADLQALEKMEGVEVETTPGAGFYYLAVSMKDERFANPKVREALRYLIDYEGLNKSIMPFYGIPHQRPLSSGVKGLLPDPGYKLDVERAKKLLAEAGYPDGMEVTLRALSEPPFINIATAMQATLAQAGIKANLITGSGDQIYGAMRERKFELIIGRGGGGQHLHPDSNLRAIAYNPDNSDEASLSNYQAWRTSFFDEKLNSMIIDALLEKNHEQQAKKYEEIQVYYEDMIPAIQPFSEVVDTAAYRTDVKGLVVNPWITRFETVTKDR